MQDHTENPWRSSLHISDLKNLELCTEMWTLSIPHIRILRLRPYIAGIMTGLNTVTGRQRWENIEYTCIYLPPHVHTCSSHGDSWNLEYVFYSREPIHKQWDALNGEWLCIRHEKRHRKHTSKDVVVTDVKHVRSTKLIKGKNPQNLGIQTMAWHVTSSRQRLQSYYHYEYCPCVF